MVPGKKTLSVSYGAFSCTLEGFDDPVAALIDVAGYFRDLAAGDRLFGAEPQMPDMATLRGLVGDRTGREVDADAAGDGVALRAAAGSAPEWGTDAEADAEADADDGDCVSAGTEAGRTASGSPPAGATGIDDPDMRDEAREHGPMPGASDDGPAAPAPRDGNDAPHDDRGVREEAAAMPPLGHGSGGEAPDPVDAPAIAPAIRSIRVRKVRADATAAIAVTPEATRGATDGEDAEVGDDLAAELAAILGGSASHRGDVPLADDDADTAFAAHLAGDGEGPEVAALPADDGDDLMAALGAIRAADAAAGDPEVADIAGEAIRHDGDELAGVPKDAADPSDAAARPPREAGPSDPDMERLFAATDSRLSGEETSRRHANISHLKAAVAARRADGPVELGSEVDTDAYRDDLASTVRPRRAPTALEGRTARPERTLPLMLVSEQRVEAPPESSDAPAPIRPRRALQGDPTEAGAEAIGQPGGGSGDAEDFERFVAEVGATELSDILEAAAVYSATVMRRDSFSRPALLHLAAEACEDLSREDGLRGFGQLLRDGTIRKVGQGAFALAGRSSRYAADAERRAG